MGLLESEARICTACRLAQTRTQVVFGVGDPDADLLLVGEAPGFNEDLQGEPFVGAAGQLLNRLLGEIGLGREDVYIANVLKCRPPNNRDPARDEVDSCKDYLRSQITIIDPGVVVTLGNFATKLLMRTETGITRLRGRTYPWWQGRTLVPTYHPAAALRSGDRLIGEMQSDFSLVRDALSRPRSTTNPPPSGKGASPEASTDTRSEAPSDGPRNEEDQAEQMNLFA
ncbi:MAG TPA: uracil-DNA glycosylase [Acidimicrobiia bacterium]|nr:uracil-DNA glycosylase [Acidimicrobiia bacterium]